MTASFYITIIKIRQNHDAKLKFSCSPWSKAIHLKILKTTAIGFGKSTRDKDRTQIYERGIVSGANTLIDTKPQPYTVLGVPLKQL